MYFFYRMFSFMYCTHVISMFISNNCELKILLVSHTFLFFTSNLSAFLSFYLFGYIYLFEFLSLLFLIFLFQSKFLILAFFGSFTWWFILFLIFIYLLDGVCATFVRYFFAMFYIYWHVFI